MLLACILKKKKYKPFELNAKVLEQLKNSGSEKCTLPHHTMNHRTFDNAQKKTKNDLFLRAYSLDRWARVPGVRTCDILIQEVFNKDIEMKVVIEEMIQYL